MAEQQEWLYISFLLRPTVNADNSVGDQMNNRPDNQDWLDDLFTFIEEDFCGAEDCKDCGERVKEIKATITTKIAEERLEELDLLDDALFPYPYKKINFTKLKEYKAERRAELEAGLKGHK